MRTLVLAFALIAVGCIDADLSSVEAEPDETVLTQPVSGSWQTAYSNYGFPGGSFFNKDIDVTIDIDPGTGAGAASSRFFSHQFSFQNTIGYFGLQTDANGKRVIFSIWDAVGASPAAGSTCLAFGGEGVGQSCRRAYNWVAGRTYRLRIWAFSATSWGAYILDRTSGQETYLGSITTRANDGWLVGASDTWTEYYGGDFAACSSLRLSRVRWSNPTANNGSIASAAPTSSVGPGACGSVRSSAGGVQSIGSRVLGQCGTLASNQRLSRGETLRSCDKRFALTMQHDGNLVLYQSGALWHSATSGTAGLETRMQTDGNLVLYPPSGAALWHTHTYGNPGASLAVQNDGNLVIYTAAGHAAWSSGTCCR